MGTTGPLGEAAFRDRGNRTRGTRCTLEVGCAREEPHENSEPAIADKPRSFLWKRRHFQTGPGPRLVGLASFVKEALTGTAKGSKRPLRRAPNVRRKQCQPTPRGWFQKWAQLYDQMTKPRREKRENGGWITVSIAKNEPTTTY